MRLFYLWRTVDETGVSGSGFVAEGVQFRNGQCVLRWRTAHTSIAIYASIADVKAIHGHGGNTVILYEDCDLVHAPTSQGIIFTGTHCNKPMPGGKEEMFDGWPGKDYQKISAFLASVESPLGRREVA